MSLIDVTNTFPAIKFHLGNLFHCWQTDVMKFRFLNNAEYIKCFYFSKVQRIWRYEPPHKKKKKHKVKKKNHETKTKQSKPQNLYMKNNFVWFSLFSEERVSDIKIIFVYLWFHLHLNYC